MQSLKARVKSFLARPRKVTTPSIHGIYPTTLAGLLPELLLSICDFLAPVDLICLSLCSYRLRELSLRQIARLPPCTEDDKILILNRLERDLPQYFACEICAILHLYDESKSYTSDELHQGETSRLSCVQWGWDGVFRSMQTHSTIPYSGSQLSFLQLKLAMRRFFYGPKSGISTDSLFYTQVRHAPPRAIYPDTVALFSREAQICPQHPGLYIRFQDIALVNEVNHLIFDPGIRLRNPDRENPIQTWIICWHMQFTSILGDVVKFFRTEGDASFDYTCPMCNTEACLEIIEFDSQIAVVLTRWVNLGLGLTQKDLLWTMQVQIPTGRRGRLDIDDPENSLSAQSPWSCFENASHQSFSRLRSHNLSYLKNHQYKTIMSFNPRLNLWHMS